MIEEIGKFACWVSEVKDGDANDIPRVRAIYENIIPSTYLLTSQCFIFG